MSEFLRVLIVDDIELYRDAIQQSLDELGVLRVATVTQAATSWDARHLYARMQPHLVFLDLKLDPGDSTGVSGERLMQELGRCGEPADIVIVTELEDDSLIRTSRRCGATHHIVKPITTEKIALAIGSTLRRHGLTCVQPQPSLPGALSEEVRRVAPWDTTVLIHGERGVGKELVAREIHRQSKRAKGPFVAVQLDAINPSLVEGQLFGWKKGAFTGAFEDQVGLIESARDGSLFLDEIGELPMDLQSKLLRVVQERRVRRLGETTERTVNFRLFSATNRDLRREVAERRFRDDLYDRIAVRTLCVPPLRERPEDLQLIVPFLLRGLEEHYETKIIHGISSMAMQKLSHYSWPGNVRQLRAVLENALIDASSESDEGGAGGVIIKDRHIQPSGVGLGPAASSELASGLSEDKTVYDNVRQLGQNQIAMLEQRGLKPSQIWELMKISRATYFRIKKGDWHPKVS